MLRGHFDKKETDMDKETRTVVDTASGKVSGVYGKGTYIFKGIPYAAPPVGERRWLPPEKHKPWDGVLEARNFGTISPQNTRELLTLKAPGFDAPEPQSEDCLYLNIWTPGLGKGSRPVMVWIHGGAFTIGSGSQPVYRGDILASRGDVVVVTINYRLGLLGFLNLNEITGGKIPATGNEGLLDQIAALQWVKDNIAAFGGDPGNVTVFGESAGGMSIGCLLAMPKARGLFHKAILESGTGSMARPLAPCVEMSKRFLEVTGLKSGDIKALRSLSVESLLAAQMELTLKAPGGITPVAPVIDGKIIPKKPLEALRSGSAKEIPTLVGSNLEEWKLFALMHPETMNIDEAGLVKIFRSFVPARDVPRLIETYQKARAGRGESTSPLELFSAIQTDVMFRVPAARTAEAQCRNGQAAYHYIFTWKSPAVGGALGACHALEMGFVFGTCDPIFCGSGPQVKQLSMKIQDGWLAFAHNGNPGCKSLGDWPPYCEKRKTMLLGKECQVKEAPYEEERRIWDDIGEVGPVG
jgi:para-nitrobenzyl esterase